MKDKVATLEQAVALVSDGDVVALQNMATQAAPMALVRELIRQQTWPNSAGPSTARGCGRPRARRWRGSGAGTSWPATNA